MSCTLRVFRRVQDRHPDATLTVVGAGSQLAALQAQAETLGLRHVRFAGAIPPRQVWRAYADAHVYLQTPNIDNMPSSVLEAFSSGNPVVSTDAGGVSAIVEHGVNGLLAPCDDDAALAAHVLRLLDDPAMAAAVAHAALRSCERYRWPMVTVPVALAVPGAHDERGGLAGPGEARVTPVPCGCPGRWIGRPGAGSRD